METLPARAGGLCGPDGGCVRVRQSSPASSAPETNFMEDSFSPDRGVAWANKRLHLTVGHEATLPSSWVCLCPRRRASPFRSPFCVVTPHVAYPISGSPTFSSAPGSPEGHFSGPLAELCD